MLAVNGSEEDRERLLAQCSAVTPTLGMPLAKSGLATHPFPTRYMSYSKKGKEYGGECWQQTQSCVSFLGLEKNQGCAVTTASLDRKGQKGW